MPFFEREVYLSMKKTILYICIVVALALTACGEDEEDTYVEPCNKLRLMSVMSLETMDYFMDRFEELIEQGMATVADARLFRNVYSLQERYRLDYWGWDGLEEYLVRYPLLPYFNEFLWLREWSAETRSEILALYCLLGIDADRVHQEKELFGRYTNMQLNLHHVSL